MKHFLTILLLAVTTFAFGAERITIITNTGDKITGSFVTGSDKQITINVDGKEGIRVFNATEIQQFTLPDGRVIVSKDGQFVSQQKIKTVETSQTETYMPEYAFRKGNSYLLNGYMMDKKAFMNTLYSTCPTAYNHFNKGYKLSKIGWGLFGGGLGLATVGGLISGIGSIQSTKGQTNYGAVIGDLFILAGSDCVTAGVVCLSIGYGKMHNSVDLYNIKVEDQQPKPTLSFNYTGTGAGIAIAW
ncbi:MAG: hypothetical protein MJZ84_03410 [Paludibacteraceae bacterium]|nr:hypothetical protein [Paludibacteraceae bacterium]